MVAGSPVTHAVQGLRPYPVMETSGHEHVVHLVLCCGRRGPRRVTVGTFRVSSGNPYTGGSASRPSAWMATRPHGHQLCPHLGISLLTRVELIWRWAVGRTHGVSLLARGGIVFQERIRFNVWCNPAVAGSSMDQSHDQRKHPILLFAIETFIACGILWPALPIVHDRPTAG